MAAIVTTKDIEKFVALAEARHANLHKADRDAFGADFTEIQKINAAVRRLENKTGIEVAYDDVDDVAGATVQRILTWCERYDVAIELV